MSVETIKYKRGAKKYNRIARGVIDGEKVVVESEYTGHSYTGMWDYCVSVMIGYDCNVALYPFKFMANWHFNRLIKRYGMEIVRDNDG